MKQYPKVARHDLPFVPDGLFSADDLHLLEKMDGANFRFMLYEERFADEYADAVHEESPSDGDIIFGTKRPVRGCVSDPIGEFDSDFQPGIMALRDISITPIREAHNNHGPLVWFAEHMVPHTLNYDYESSPPPALIGFDLYAQRQDSREPSDFPGNPYKERHVGYLGIDEARSLFDSIGIPFTPVVKSPDELTGSFDPENFDVPMSEYGDVQAEGVVLRSDSLNARAKFVTEAFRELHKMSMGGQPGKADDPVQWIVDALVTPARVRKHVRRLVTEEGYEFSLDERFIEASTRVVLADAWAEEFAEIRELEESFAPADAHRKAQERVRHVIERMKQMAARTDSDPTTAWTSIDGGKVAAPQPTETDRVSSVERSVARRLQDGVSPERALFDELVGGMERIEKELDALVKQEEKELAGWAVEPATERLIDAFWVSETSCEVLWQLHIEFTPSAVKTMIQDLVCDRIEERADVDLDAGGEPWEPNEEDADAGALGDLF